MQVDGGGAPGTDPLEIQLELGGLHNRRCVDAAEVKANKSALLAVCLITDANLDGGAERGCGITVIDIRIGAGGGVRLQQKCQRRRADSNAVTPDASGSTACQRSGGGDAYG